ncbi:MAG: glycosyltransferase 61 family protein [Terracidiphilus sp.]
MTSSPPAHGVFENIRVEAYKHPFGVAFHGGPVLRDPEFTQFRHKRGNVACDTFDEGASFQKYVEGKWVYIGPKYPHFGHVMAEMIHRILPSKLFFPEVNKYLIVTTFDDESGPGFETLCATYREALEFLDIEPDSVLIINENSVVESLSICEQASNLGGIQTQWYLDALRDYSAPRLDQLHGGEIQHPKVYVSKSRMPHGGRILGASYVEELLSEEGFLIFYPEEAPLSVQLDTYRKASVLLFEEGSACHGTELLGTEMLNRTFLIVRRMEGRDGFAKILRPRSKEYESFQDTFFLGTIIVNKAKRFPQFEYGVSLFDLDRFVAFLRDRGLAELKEIDVRRYYEAAERDLRDYFTFHMQNEIEEVDLWRVGELRLEFEKLRQRFLSGHAPLLLNVSAQAVLDGDAESIWDNAWAAHHSGEWLEAAHLWEVYRERFPNSSEGFAHGSYALIELGRFYEADAVLLPAMERFPFAEVFSNYALVAHHRHDWREAVTRWELFRDRFPEYRIGFSLESVALCELGRFVEADSLVLKGLEFHPDDEELLENYAWVAQRQEDWPEAKRRWERLIGIHTENRAAAKNLQELPS